MRIMLVALLTFVSGSYVAAASVVVLDGTNRPLGVYAGPITSNGDGVRVITPEGYAFGVKWSGEFAVDGFNPESTAPMFFNGPVLSYDSTDCSGQPYVDSRALPRVA